MTDETNQLAPEPDIETATPERDTPEADEPQKVEDVQPEETEAEGAEDTEQPEVPEPELINVEYEGKQYKLPSELKDALLRHGDYTRKTQEVADQRRELEQFRTNLEQQHQLSSEEMNGRVALYSMNQQLQQYEQVDWDAWEREDPVAAQGQWRQYQALEKSRDRMANWLNGAEQQRVQGAQQETARRVEQTLDYAKKNIEGWTPEMDQKVTEFASTVLGHQPHEILAAVNPQVYRTLYLAWRGHQALESQKAAPKPKPPAIQPLKTVNAKSNPTGKKDLGSMSMEEYAEYHRNREARSAR